MYVLGIYSTDFQSPYGGEMRVSYFIASHLSPPVWTVLSSYSVLGSFSIPVFYLVLAFLYFITKKKV